MATLDCLLDHILTPLCGPRCPRCSHRRGRSHFAQFDHDWFNHNDARPNW